MNKFAKLFKDKVSGCGDAAGLRDIVNWLLLLLSEQTGGEEHAGGIGRLGVKPMMTFTTAVQQAHVEAKVIPGETELKGTEARPVANFGGSCQGSSTLAPIGFIVDKSRQAEKGGVYWRADAPTPT